MEKAQAIRGTNVLGVITSNKKKLSGVEAYERAETKDVSFSPTPPSFRIWDDADQSNPIILSEDWLINANTNAEKKAIYSCKFIYKATRDSPGTMPFRLQLTVKDDFTTYTINSDTISGTGLSNGQERSVSLNGSFKQLFSLVPEFRRNRIEYITIAIKATEIGASPEADLTLSTSFKVLNKGV